MGTQRVKYTLVVSSNDNTFDNCVNDAVIGLTHLFGGCTFHEAMGTWLQTATETCDTYHGRVGYEKAIVFGIIMMPEEEATKVHDMKAIIASAFEGVADWVHVERTMVDGLHFSINALLG